MFKKKLQPSHASHILSLYRSQARTFGCPGLMLLCVLLGTISLVAGCPRPEPIEEDETTEIELAAPDPLTLLIIDDAKLGDVVARQWSARRDGKLTIVNQTSALFAEQNFKFAEEIDVIIYPIGMLGELESRSLIAMLPRSVWSSDELNKNEILRLHRTTLVRHGDETWAVPLGGPQWSLMYSQSFFDKEKFSIPKDWEQLVELSDKLRPDKDSPNSGAGLELPLGEGWAAQVFLARVATAIRSRGKLSTVFERESMTPLIAEPPFVAALNDLKTIMAGDIKMLELTPNSVFQHILAGQAAMGMTWPQRTSDDRARPESSDAGKGEFGFMMIPGTPQWFDLKTRKWAQRQSDEDTKIPSIGFAGLLGSVSADSRDKETAFDFLEWLASKSISLVTMIESPLSGPYRESHLGDPTRWTGSQISDSSAQQYADVIQAVNDQNVVLMFPRIPGRQRYLDELDLAIRSCLRGEQEAAAALQDAAKKWDAITDELNRKKQIAELRKDAGL